ncbi:amino acid/amide ABC transporter substrate-binding protein, HAAT family [Hyunsoonleella jejuensis]|uniref:Amino acid/amide ABC transporter substrate-binding protein, HAAT family n=1 Tax=Hyunsoonleella jejuensis TaxID=419940 RepID=A0A1H9H3Y8_9FLAO|nr:LysM peptidoglycan-binding domain-containing protein [Hyunsoonleella jejuensis]SEQ57061.1 amino acid/amide ABC transporter substrate-binding protein, HAAT family [Hyunsoonleella jejuensis]
MNRFFLVIVLLLCFGMTSINAQNYSTHQVKKGETIEGIAKRYYVTPFDIYSLNPDAKKGLKPNTILIIPISKAKKPKITEIKELQGFKSHKAKRKETLYSISKKYDVEIEDIKKYNTFLYANNLKKGDKLQIPVFKITKVEEEVVENKTYIVQPKEGKWRIAYKFGITVAELEALNPKMGEVLQEGQQIYVPNIDKGEEKQIDDKYSYYKVLPKEGFYRLKIKLDLEKEELEALNPELVESGLKAGMILKIPFSETKGIISEDLVTTNLISKINDYDTKHLALMLPFRLNRVEFDSIAETKRSIEKDPYLDASLDFYSGVLMAIDSLKKLGLSIKLDVYDTKYQPTAVSRILADNDFENVDAIIGPLTTKNFNTVANELRKYNIPVVSPIGTKIKLYDNVFQTRPSDDLLKSKVINYIKNDSLPKNILILADSKNMAIANELKREFNEAVIVFSRKNKEGKDEYFVTKEDIETALKPGKNIVFLETQNESFISGATSILAALNLKEDPEKPEQEKAEILLTTTRFNGAFEGDEVNNTHLSKLQFTFATSSKSLSEDEQNTFIKNYQKAYNITPGKRAVKGFDLTMDVVLRMVTSEDLFMSVNHAPLTAYVENKFAYKKKLFGGYYNDAVYLVKYDDLKIIEVMAQ